MPTNQASRFLLILAILLCALWCIFPGAHRGRFEPNLKPGIDMVGGTSLLYEIKAPEGGGATHGSATGSLADDVMAALKKRVDPDGVRNLIWRPQGNTRLEIQMPLSRNAGESSAKRKAFSEAQSELERTNLRAGDVLRAVETQKGDARRAALDRMALDSDARKKLFGALASTWDQLQEAKTKQDAAAQADRELEYQKLKDQIEDTNVSSSTLESTLAASDGEAKFAAIKKEVAGFPARVAALDRFAAAYKSYQSVKGSLDDAGDLKRLLKGSGVLEFHIVAEYDHNNPSPQLRPMFDRLQKRGPVVEANDTTRWYLLDHSDEMPDLAVPYNGQFYVLAYTDVDKSMTNRPGQLAWALEKAYPTTDPQSNERSVGFTFNPQGAQLFGDLSGANIGKRLGIVLDDRMISAPNLQSKINGSGVITGNRQAGGFTQKEQGYLVSMLSAGSLPARLTDEPISERTVGPQLGADNLRAGLMSCFVGAILVVFFMIGYYYLSGLIACVALSMNIVLILGIMAALNATFTLPGVAAIVLTIGMAVDANVLIYERLREELERGLSVRMALRNAYDRAFSAILDGNVTTAITSLVLYLMGSEEVKGFGLTLLIGIGCSLFTALFVTKTIFAWMLDHGYITKLGSIPQTFPWWQKFLHPDVDWMGKAKYFYAFSFIFITIGLGLFAYKIHTNEMLDIEFASGTSVGLEMKKPTELAEVRKLVMKVSEERPKDLPAPTIQSVGSSGLEFEVITPNPNAPAVKAGLLAALGDKLKIDLPSTFENVGLPANEVIGKSIIPIDSAQADLPGVSPDVVAKHVGGAAIVLKDLNPPVKPSEIHARIDGLRLQSNVPYREYDVVGQAGGDAPTSMATILISDAALPHSEDAARWESELTTPMWKLASDAINHPAGLQKVMNFDAQVAGETTREAIIALLMSIGGIMAYIWIRFGNLKYGAATVVALLHDVAITVAAIGFSHVVVGLPGIGYFFSHVLLVEPFRINLTIIAAILTVMGYSMNDTVVVFDRIRENRGKYGMANRKVINDSINQTLSRTLLTSGCTLVTCTTMYFLGGPGVHGFTYCLVLGILVGTYSSIAIASPILLLGDSKVAEESRKSREPVGQLQRA